MTMKPQNPQQTTKQKRSRVVVKRQVQEILNWPTETVSIDHSESDAQRAPLHSVLLFCPGNPGCIEWYIPLLERLVSSLGVGHAARGVSYAGHGASDNIANVERLSSTRDAKVAWTVNGQIDHKVAWIDMIIQEMSGPSSTQPHFIFITHSIGAHLMQRLLIMRPDILSMTRQVIHLMPFMRMDAPQPQQWILSTISKNPRAVIFVAQQLSRACQRLPVSWLDFMLKRSVEDENGRKVAISLVQQPHMARNFFELGCEEIRDVPQVPDTWAMNMIGRHCPTSILFGGGPDHWAPEFHMCDLQQLQAEGRLSKNIYCCFNNQLRHDFVVVPEMVDVVAPYCLDSIRNPETTTTTTALHMARLQPVISQIDRLDELVAYHTSAYVYSS